MFAISIALGNRYYPIPYKWRRIAGVFIAMGVFYGISLVMDRFVWETPAMASRNGILALKLGFNTVLIAAYLIFGYFFVYRKNQYRTSPNTPPAKMT